MLVPERVEAMLMQGRMELLHMDLIRNTTQYTCIVMYLEILQVHKNKKVAHVVWRPRGN